MFQRFSKSRGFLALLLPLTFVWSWAACTLLCGEITAHHEETSYSVSAQNEEVCLVAFDIERCPVTAAGAVAEARQMFFSHVLAVKKTDARAPREFLFVRTSVSPPDTAQNSPPHSLSAPPLFLRHSAFRI